MTTRTSKTSRFHSSRPITVGGPVHSDSRQDGLSEFPAVPEGVTIVPFKEFKERGIRSVVDADGEERDILGIPTIALKYKHRTDISKTDPSKKSLAPRTVVGPVFQRQWWHDWAEAEDLRTKGDYNIADSLGDRLHRGASDFQKFRQFPPYSTNVRFLWNQFKIFAGLLTAIPVWTKASDRADEDKEEDSDVDFEATEAAPTRPRAPYDLYGVKPVVVGTQDEICSLLETARAEKDERLHTFLSDPERAVRIFLSSYMSDQNLILTDRNLVSTPHLLRFFLKYLLRNQVLPDTFEPSLTNALAVIDLASKELPLTSQISKAIPDMFAKGCQGCWGAQRESSSVVSHTDKADSITSGPDTQTNKPTGLFDDATFESILKADNLELIKEDPIPTAPNTDPSASWDGVPVESDWASFTLPSLLSILGPTVLPLTHAPGVVESSVRRITVITAPTPALGSHRDSRRDWIADPEAVEQDLAQRMYRITMEPWLRENSADADKHFVPRILKSSRGGGIGSSGMTLSEMGDGVSKVKPHDIFRDAITVLVDSAVGQILCVGMGLEGTWIQLARLENNTEVGDGGAVTEMQPDTRYWYLDALLTVLPSYWAAQ